MNSSVEILSILVSPISDLIVNMFTSISEVVSMPGVGSGVAIAFALGAVTFGIIPEGVLANIRKWHGSIEEQFSNIDNLVNLVTAHQSTWTMPPDLYTQLTNADKQVSHQCGFGGRPHAS